MDITNNPQLAHSLAAYLTRVGTSGTMVGDISKRVAEHLINRIRREISRSGGAAAIATAATRTPIGFTIIEIGASTSAVLDGIPLAIL